MKGRHCARAGGQTGNGETAGRRVNRGSLAAAPAVDVGSRVTSWSELTGWSGRAGHIVQRRRVGTARIPGSCVPTEGAVGKETTRTQRRGPPGVDGRRFAGGSGGGGNRAGAAAGGRDKVKAGLGGDTFSFFFSALMEQRRGQSLRQRTSHSSNAWPAWMHGWWDYARLSLRTPSPLPSSQTVNGCDARRRPWLGVKGDTR